MARFFLTAEELASYLDSPVTPALTQIVALTNALVEDEWRNPDPTNTAVPAFVTAIAWAVAIRAGSNPKGLSSWTRKWDDISRTERQEGSQQVGVYLTDEERAQLHGGAPPLRRRVKSIKLGIPGWTV